MEFFDLNARAWYREPGELIGELHERTHTGTATNQDTLYTVPAGKRLYLLSLSLSCSWNAGGSTAGYFTANLGTYASGGTDRGILVLNGWKSTLVDHLSQTWGGVVILEAGDTLYSYLDTNAGWLGLYAGWTGWLVDA